MRSSEIGLLTLSQLPSFSQRSRVWVILMLEEGVQVPITRLCVYVETGKEGHDILLIDNPSQNGIDIWPTCLLFVFDVGKLIRGNLFFLIGS